MLRPKSALALLCLAETALAAGCKEHGAAAERASAPTASVVRSPSSAPPSGLASGSPSAPRPPSDPAGRTWSTEPRALAVPDRGIYSELDARVRLRFPSWLSGAPVVRLTPAGSAVGFAYVGTVAVGLAQPGVGPEIGAPGARDPNDADGDGIPDALDILVGGKKVVLNGAAYRSTYRVLPYPGGDVPRTEGVCTDVVIRALRNAGIDLQQLVHEDILQRPGAYPSVKRPDRSIDHRRVRNLVPFFERHFESLPPNPHDGSVPLLPGDIVILDTLPGPGPEHLGIVSDQLGESGLPLVINNWTDGYSTSEMDLLRFVTVTHRFRMPRKPLPVVDAQRGVSGLLARHHLEIPGRHRQLLLVCAASWTSTGGTLERFERKTGEDAWQKVGDTVTVRLGTAGLGRGRGLHDRMPDAILDGPTKSEGDRRSPAGVFALGTAFGRGAAPTATRWPWRATDERDRFVDDGDSPQYNTWQRAQADGRADPWRSAERLNEYQLAIVVEHNTDPIRPGAGSAIFVHVWGSPTKTTAGCTAMSEPTIKTLLAWLDPAQDPVLVQLPGFVY